MIGLEINQLCFENDVRALIMAFFPGEKIVLGDMSGEYNVQVLFEEGTVIEKNTVDLSEEAKAAFSVLLMKSGENVSKVTSTCPTKDYKTARNRVKRAVYNCFKAHLGQDLPWGTLTGIRPTKIAMSLLEQNLSDEDIEKYFKEEYFLSDEKMELCVSVAKNEHQILKDMDYRNTYSLYVGIPFCPTICAYCSFSSFPLAVWKDKVDDYLDALCKELDYLASVPTDKKLLTLYMGGGTPTSLSAPQMDRLLHKLSSLYDFSHIKEITVEAGRPDSITLDKLQVIKSYGIDRISINPQTMKQETLDRIGRRHTVEQIKEAFAMARSVGFGNINMDLIAGLTGESPMDMEDTLHQIEALGPDSMTVHSLAVKRAAYLNQNRDQFTMATPQEINTMIGQSFESAKRMGMEPYYLYRQKNIAGNLENVGYAKPGCEGLYNILIMEEKQSIAAAGAGASTKMVIHDENRIERIENVKSVKDYIERIDEMIERKKQLIL